MNEPTAVIFGWRKPELDVDAAGFFRAANPWGFILMGEACQSPTQMTTLIQALQEAVGRPAVVFVDQEGGRVARLGPPEWPQYPAAASYAALYQRDPELGVEACQIGYRLIAEALRLAGVRANCAPVLDVLHAGAHPVVGDRAFGADPLQVAALGRAALTGLQDGGVAGVIKHMPGHGRATVDSHVALPRIEADVETLEADLAPFRALKDAPMAMTAHAVFTAWDRRLPATLSPTVISKVIRGLIGFEGLLITDDLGMKALSGDWWEKSEAALAAGCDMLLHCSGALAEMERIAMAVPGLSGKALERARQAEAAALAEPKPLDAERAWEDLSILLSEVETA